MEPHAKRLRILQSVEVDETDAEYIAAKEKQRAKLKSKFESIFSRFEAMPDAMTDEIDMRTGEIVVDRGHMRRLDRAYRHRHGRRTGQLLDDLMADDVEEGEENTEDEENESVRDELAPSKSPEPRNRKQEMDINHSTEAVAPPSHIPNSYQQACQVDIPPPYTPSRLASKPNALPAIPSEPSASANWMQMVQFPQTPAGQLAQNVFMTQITQAVQQAITPIISNLLTNTPGAQGQPAAPLQASVPTGDPDSENTPSSETTLRYPPSTEASDAPAASASSPLLVRPTSPRKRRFARGVYIWSTRRKQFPNRNHGSSTSQENKSSEIENVQGRVAEAENMLNEGLQEYSHERNGQHSIDKQPLRFPRSSLLRTSSPNELPHLPTPSSLSQDETKELDKKQKALVEGLDTIIASGRHFDDDERDLLSLAGTDESKEDLPLRGESPVDKDETESTEIILPSIEADAFIEDDMPMNNATELAVPSRRDPEELKEPTSISKPVIPSSATRMKPRRQPINFQLDSDSEEGDQLDLVGISTPSKPTVKTTTSLTCTTCNKPFKSERTLSKHQRKYHQSTTAITTEDELLAAPSSPFTPVIKRESLSPPSNFLLATPTAFQTPRSAPQPTTIQSSGSKTTSKMARSAFLKKVKQSWAKNKSGTSEQKRERASLAFTPRKRMWVGDDDGEDSGDELAL
ncbi:hypothetical protein CC80DRAFT_495754 [Byssothecium circinans]|uniref:C2H2-type domain-containing protein n=1 Tax=Byssothecium circinans TaxID=147558 RepID=A0A6A5TJP1_9PLEO|nr:hypothetical protein CC80DRAFT_495754 [Byssothecium circinans]